MSNNISLLLSLDAHHFEEVRNELELVKDGIIFHHVLDHDEFVRYLLPYRNQFKYKEDIGEHNDIKYIADELFALDNIFRNNERKAILFKEYYYELSNIKKYIRAEAEFGEKDFRSAKKYYTKYNSIGTLNDAHHDHLARILETKNLIAYCLGFITNGLKKYSDVINSRGLIGEEDFLSTFKEKYDIDNLFYDFELNQSRYSSVLDQFRFKTSKLSFTDEFERLAKEFSNERDSKAIAKVIFLNDKLSLAYRNKTSMEQHVFLYLSSTQNSDFVFYESKIQRDIKKKVNDKILNVCRNNGQIFLNLLCSKTPDPTKSLDEIRELCDSLKAEEDKVSKIDEILKRKLTYAREELENYTILSNFENYRKTVKEALDTVGSQSGKENILVDFELVKALNDLLDLGSDKEEIYRANKSNFENADILIKFREAINEGIEILDEDLDHIYAFPIGLDNIRGKMSIFPITYYYDDDNFQEIATLIADFIVNNDYFQSKVYKNFLESTITKYLSTIEPSPEEKLLRALILIILPSKNMSINNKIALDWVKYILQSQVLIITDNSSMIGDYCYFILWLGRRMEQYRETLSFLESYSEYLLSDPRFSHGKSLVYYSMFKNYKSDVENIKLAIQHGSDAVNRYRSIDKTDLEKRIMYSIYNSLSYYYIEWYIFTEKKNKSLLIQSREELFTLKTNEESAYKNFPEYLHTEAHLELLESEEIIRQFEEENDELLKHEHKTRVSQKISSAFGDIRRAILLLSKNDDGVRKARYFNLMNDISDLQKVISNL